MKTSKDGINLIKKFEGFVPTVYLCPAGKRTIGYGHVITKGTNYGTITEEEASEILQKDLLTFENKVNRLVKKPLKQNQFDALISFTYNVGATNLSTSTLLRRINAGDYNVGNEFVKWVFCSILENGKRVKKTLPGLVKRREAEKNLWNGKNE